MVRAAAAAMLGLLLHVASAAAQEAVGREIKSLRPLPQVV